MQNLSVKKGLSTNNWAFIWEIINSLKEILSQKYYPVLKVTRKYNSPVEWIQISHNLNKLMNYNIPITYTTQTHHHFTGTLNNTSLHKLLNVGLYLKFKKDSWILFNIQQIGKYVTNLSHFIMFIT